MAQTILGKWMSMKKILFSILLLSSNYCLAFNYGEHQSIGNKAMSMFLGNNQIFENSLFYQYSPFEYNNVSNTYIFSNLSINNLPIGYGTINALSGDHSQDPLALEQQLLTQSSNLLKIISLHNQFLIQGYSGAPDGQLTKVDPNYASLAIRNLCHFYEYGKGMQENIDCFNILDIDLLINPSTIGDVIKKLNSTNAINMYITMHTTAIYLAEIAGIKARSNDPEAKKYLYYAFLYNGFADHFLEDAFSGGHLLVNRTMFGSLTNNKSLHDFYSKYGTQVVNLRGEKWIAYGDGFCNHYHDEYQKQNSLQNVNYPVETNETQRIIEAVHLSISEIFKAFQNSSQGDLLNNQITKRLPTNNNDILYKFLIDNFNALTIIPLPYNSNLKSLMPDNLSANKQIQSINKSPYYRNFVRSRIANSLIFGGNTGLIYDESTKYTNSYLRINYGLINSKYDFNNRNGKKGMVDIWNGYTISATLGHYLKDDIDVTGQNWILKGGIRSNYDFWLTDKRFLGVYMYNEFGMENKNNKNAFVYVPQIGFQFSSLLNINYYNMPIWLRIPVQVFLPLRIHVGCVYSNKNSPLYFIGSEYTITF